MKLPGIKQYPKEVMVGDTVWSIKFCRDLDGCLGLCIPDLKEIRILYKQTRYETLLTAVHELIHAAEDEYDFQIPESTVLKLEKAITNFILANSPIFDI